MADEYFTHWQWALRSLVERRLLTEEECEKQQSQSIDPTPVPREEFERLHEAWAKMNQPRQVAAHYTSMRYRV